MENVRKVVRDLGPVSIFDSKGEVQRLKDGNLDTWAMVEKADMFIFAGSRYSRADFEKLLDRLISKPGNAFQLNLPTS
jgi:hypothetical protein